MIILSENLRLAQLDDALEKAVTDALVEIAMNYNQGDIFHFSPFFPVSLGVSPRDQTGETQILTVDLRRGGTVEGTAEGFFRAARDDVVRPVLEKVVKERHLASLMDALLSGDGS